ncbi:hypothetical protein C8Q80DRAFT_1123385 [Daedaleopsis nitida]|nr:hypothetical protein C8Q80DRAFT_1123385 [Daedaleopsis nitida]
MKQCPNGDADLSDGNGPTTLIICIGMLLDREMKESLRQDDAPAYRELASIGSDVDFPKFAQVQEQQGDHQLILIYAEPERVGDIEEVVLNLQRYLLDASLPPIRQHNLPRNHNRLIDLKQLVTLTGLASEKYHDAVRGMGTIRGGHLRTWALGCDGEESLTLSFSNRILTPAKDTEGKREYGLEHLINPFNVLRPLLRSEVHTVENHVEYWSRTEHRPDDVKNSCPRFDRYKPEFFNLSNMVEVQVSFQAIRVARHDYVFIPKLQALCLLHRTAEVVSLRQNYYIAAIEAIARAPVSPMKKVKQKVGYGSSDDNEGEEEALPRTAMKHLHLDDDDGSHNQVMRVSAT